jgi:hypothetical protein
MALSGRQVFAHCDSLSCLINGALLAMAIQSEFGGSVAFEPSNAKAAGAAELHAIAPP